MVLRLGSETHVFDRDEAAELRDQLAEALTERHEFLRTAGEHREDGSYVVSRRGADSSGHRKVFERFAHLRRLYDRLPEGFTAEDVGRSGLTGGRRHMVVRHFVEHPAFNCELVSQQPLTVEKRQKPADGENADPATEEVVAPTD